MFVDEAYIDYLGNPKDFTMLDCCDKGQNVIVARTLSKLYGFAGLRLGYIMAKPDLLKKIEPYSTSFYTISAPAAFMLPLPALTMRLFCKAHLTKNRKQQAIPVHAN